RAVTAGGVAHHDLVVLDKGVGEQPLAHLLEARGVVDLELDEPPDAHVAHISEAECRKRPLDGLALRVEDAGLGPDEDPRPHGAVRASQWSNDSPAIFSYASMYRARVPSTTSSGSSGAGGALSQPVPLAQSRTYCLSKLGWARPGAYAWA